jgi:hypothetical protein
MTRSPRAIGRRRPMISLRASPAARGRAARFRGASRLAPLGPVLTSSGTGRKGGRHGRPPHSEAAQPPRARRPFHSRPHRLADRSSRVGMKGAGRSSPPRRSKPRGVGDASARANGAEGAVRRHRSERSERGAQRGAAVRATGGFHAVCGGCRGHRFGGFQAVGGCCLSWPAKPTSHAVYGSTVSDLGANSKRT